MTDGEAPDSSDSVRLRIEATAPATYANLVQLLRTENEIFFDFYFAAPPIAGDDRARHVARIALPTTVWRGFLDALSSQVEQHEQEHGALPNFRAKRLQSELDQGDK